MIQRAGGSLFTIVLVLGLSAGQPSAKADLLINETDADQTSTDTQEFVELYNTGPSPVDFSASPHVLVFYNGNGDVSYFAIDLTGVLAVGDYLVVGSSTVPNLDIDFCTPSGGGCSNMLQNGPDAVALYTGNAAAFPNGTAVTAASIVDAIVYDTADPDVPGLINVLTPGQPQVDEAGGGNKDIHSNQRCPDGSGGALNTTTYGQAIPTPGATNSCTVVPVGACCFTDGTCTINSAANCAAAGGSYQGDLTGCDPNPCPQPSGACCDAQGGCTTGQTQQLCENGGGIYLGNGTDCTGGCPDYTGILINEVRIDQTSADNDEYFELVGPAGASLSGLTYLVIGDSSAGGLSGVVEEAVELTLLFIPADGHFLAAEDADTFGAVADLITSLNFENSDNVTHITVAGFRGAIGDDLDLDDDCTLDVTPWVSVIDTVALREFNNPPVGAGNECHYGVGSEIVGPDGSFVPGHVYRLPDAGLPWNIGPFDPTNGHDTPGVVNALATGACCAGYVCTIETQADCENVIFGIYKGTGVPCTPDPCIGACCESDGAGGYTCDDTLTQADCLALPGTYMGDTTTCTPDPCVCADIEAAKLAASGNTLIVCTVTIANLEDTISSTSRATFTIQDTSGTNTGGPGGSTRGILVVGHVNDLDIDALILTLNEGDVIDITGDVGDFANVRQLNIRAAADLTVTGTTAVPTPVAITTADLIDGSTTGEALESVLSQLQCVAFIDGGTFAGVTTYFVTDGLNVIEARVPTGGAPLVGQPIPFGPVDLTGVFLQYAFNVPPPEEGYQLIIRRPGDIAAATCAGPVGACCFTNGTCFEAPQSICEFNDGTYIIPGIYQGDGTNCATANCPAVTGACCINSVCSEPVVQLDCEAQGGAFLGEGSTCALGCPDPTAVIINEIRIDQPAADDSEYFELKGAPGTPLGTLTYVVIGDGSGVGDSGVIEAAVSLAGQAMPLDGLFVAAESTFDTVQFGNVVDLTTTFSFENGDNGTHLLVAGFTGSVGDDLDTNDDCVLDLTPWTTVIDKIALILEENPPVTTECHYGPPTVGPDGTFAPAHVYRCTGGAGGDWIIGPFDIALGEDTPGAENPCGGIVCVTCLGDMDGNGTVNFDDIDDFVLAILSPAPGPCADVDGSTEINGLDVAELVNKVLANNGAGTSCNPPRDVIQCLEAGGPGPTCDLNFCTWDMIGPVAGAPTQCLDVLPAFPPFDHACMPDCPPSFLCPGGSPVQFRWVNWDGAGNDCWFEATPVQFDCEDCFADPFRFADVAP